MVTDIRWGVGLATAAALATQLWLAGLWNGAFATVRITYSFSSAREVRLRLRGTARPNERRGTAAAVAILHHPPRRSGRTMLPLPQPLLLSAAPPVSLAAAARAVVAIDRSQR